MGADQHASLQLSLQKSILHHYRVIGTSDMQLTCSIAGVRDKAAVDRLACQSPLVVTPGKQP
jgi:hypothetical protein